MSDTPKFNGNTFSKFIMVLGILFMLFGAVVGNKSNNVAVSGLVSGSIILYLGVALLMSCRAPRKEIKWKCPDCGHENEFLESFIEVAGKTCSNCRTYTSMVDIKG